MSVAVGRGYSDLLVEIRQQGLLKRRPGFYTCYFLAIVAALVGITAMMMSWRQSWLLLLLAPMFAVVSTQSGFLGHDVGHRQVARGRGLSRILGLVTGNLLTGLSYGWWVAKHNAHHAHPNDLESDPDVRAGALVFDATQAAGRRGLAGWTTRHQAALFFPFLLLEAGNLHVSSVVAVLRPGLRDRVAEGALLAVHFVAYAALIVTSLTWAQALVFVAVHKGLQGVYLGCSFAPAHKGMPVLTPEQADDPLLRQVLTSRNVIGSPFTDLVMGGLNYQIEHHLFPNMPRVNLRRAAPVVRQFCLERGVSYQEMSALASYGLVLRHLSSVGSELRGGPDDHASSL
jgi:fatty acid desaturase